MILVTLGTQDKEFTRLVKAVDDLVRKGIIREKVYVQLGYTKYESPYLEGFSLKPAPQLNKLMSQADLIITHGGVGSILEPLRMNKKIIAMARLKKYKEHTNNHQLQIVDEFARQGYLIKIESSADLEAALNKVKKFKPRLFKSNNQSFVQMIADYIDDHYQE